MRATRAIALLLWLVLLSDIHAGQNTRSMQQEPSPPETPAVAAQSCTREAAQLVKRLSIEYPQESQENETQGSVRVEVTLDSTGKIASLHALAGPPKLVDAVVRAANKWSNEPIVEGGLQKALTLDVDFSIELEHPSPVPFPKIENADDAVVTLERGGCYGSCPVYRLKIKRDGTVEYEGDSYVFLQGNHRARISKDEVNQLLADFRSADYFSLDDKYIYRRPTEILLRSQGCSNKLSWQYGMTTDLPSTLTSITIDSKTKQVVDYDGAPPALRQLETQIDELAHSARWLRGTAETVPGLQAEGYDINARNPNGWSAILGASEYSDAKTLGDLISAGANVNVSNSDGHTPLMLAALRDLADMVADLLRAGADPRARDTDGRSVLMYGFTGGNEAVVEELLKTRLDVNARTRDGNTALMAAAASGNPKIVRLILLRNPRVNLHGHNGTTALIAGSTGELEWETEYAFGPRAQIPDDAVDRGAVVKMLISAGANVNATDNDGETALFTLEDDAIEELIKAKMNLNARNKEGDTALGDTVSGDVAKLLVEAGAGMELANPRGTTPLMHAAGRNYLDILDVLIRAGAKMDRQDNEGRTALIYAVNEGLPDALKILLQARASVSIKDRQGQTALTLAKKGLETSKEGYKITAYNQIIKQLTSAGAID
ncbi:MAG: TonB family protein [Candidatus Acidiferrales bacterium]